jgi:uncharacterized protein YdiU (UPF0061 family)
MVINTLQ